MSLIEFFQTSALENKMPEIEAAKETMIDPESAKSKASSPTAVSFHWPIFLALAVPFIFLAMVGWAFYQDYRLFLRIGWIGLCSVVPGLYLMVIVGSLSRFKRRPLVSLVSLLIGLAMLVGCYVAVQEIILLTR
jgi:hypothetical protein